MIFVQVWIIAIHEFQIMHGFSWWHTHKRGDRDAYITVNYDNIQDDRRNEFDKCTNTCNLWGQPYDCGSIMHYAKDQMSKNGKDTISSKRCNTGLLNFGQWNSKTNYMSSQDISFLRSQYC